MKQKKELVFEAFDLHTCALNNGCSSIALSAEGYLEGEEITLTMVLPDFDFINFISHQEIDAIKDNLKKRIDNL